MNCKLQLYFIFKKTTKQLLAARWILITADIRQHRASEMEPSVVFRKSNTSHPHYNTADGMDLDGWPNSHHIGNVTDRW